MTESSKKERHKLYMREYRKKARDAIEQQEIDNAKSIKEKTEKQKQQQKQKTSEPEWREPETQLNPQYPKEPERYDLNIFGSSTTDKPKPKSNQSRLKEEFSGYVE